MKVELPQEYITQAFLQYAHQATIQRGTNVLNGGCPSCREGRSFGKRKRLFFVPKHNRIHCKNCNRTWDPVSWIMEMSGKSFSDVIKESKEYEYVPAELIYREQSAKPIITEVLPKDSINLFDPLQVDFYKDKFVVQEALKLINARKLDTLVNRSNSLFLSLNDYVHKNRLIIPFIGLDGKTDFYQTRTILKSDSSLPKYLGKVGSDKTVFGIDRISTDLDYIFIFEGPIDAMTTKNGVAIAGVTMSELQKEQLKNFPFHQRIWVLDNQYIDDTAKMKTKELVAN